MQLKEDLAGIRPAVDVETIKKFEYGSGAVL